MIFFLAVLMAPKHSASFKIQQQLFLICQPGGLIAAANNLPLQSADKFQVYLSGFILLILLFLDVSFPKNKKDPLNLRPSKDLRVSSNQE